MAFSYDPLLQTSRDRVRHSLADTVAPGFRPDETYDALLAQHTEQETVVILAEGLLAEFSLLPDSISIPGGPSISFRSRLDLWRSLASNGGTLEEGGGSGGAITSGSAVRGDLAQWTKGEYYSYRLGDNMELVDGGCYWVDAE